MSGWQTAMTKQRDRFLEESKQRLSQCHAQAQQLEGQMWEKSLLKSISRACHLLAGSSGFFELSNFANHASSCEQLCIRFMEKKADLSLADVKRLQQELHKLDLLLADTPQVAEGQEEAKPDAEQKKSMLLLCADPRLSLHLTSKLADLKLVNHSYRSFDSAKEHIESERLDAIVLVSPIGEGDTATLVELYRKKQPHGLVIVLSNNEEFSTKVTTIRQGVDGFFEAPFDLDQVHARLRELIDKESTYLYRVLSVEDDPVQAEIIAGTLQAAGYLVLSLQDASQFEETLISFSPDLLLLDVDLGSLSGFDLAKYVRGLDRFNNLPIVFLTTRGQLDSFVEGARSGGDEYLVKPVSTQYMIAAITSRIERYRSLQKSIERDGLTRAYTYSNFLLRCQKYLNIHHNYNAMVVFDVDNLGSINNTLGLAAGDRAIGAAAGIVRAVFRHVELIGRTAGGEIAVMTPTRDPAELAQICTYAISQIAATAVFGPNVQTALSMSAGIAELTGSPPDARAGLDMARKALSLAKSNGKGCAVRLPAAQ